MTAAAEQAAPTVDNSSCHVGSDRKSFVVPRKSSATTGGKSLLFIDSYCVRDPAKEEMATKGNVAARDSSVLNQKEKRRSLLDKVLGRNKRPSSSRSSSRHGTLEVAADAAAEEDTAVTSKPDNATEGMLSEETEEVTCDSVKENQTVKRRSLIDKIIGRNQSSPRFSQFRSTTTSESAEEEAVMMEEEKQEKQAKKAGSGEEKVEKHYPTHPLKLRQRTEDILVDLSAPFFEMPDRLPSMDEEPYRRLPSMDEEPYLLPSMDEEPYLLPSFDEEPVRDSVVIKRPSQEEEEVIEPTRRGGFYAVTPYY